MCKHCCGKGGCTVSMIVKILVVIGGVNWGLVGLGMLIGSLDGWNVVNMVLGSAPWLEAIVYVLVGVAAVMMIFGCKCGRCMSGICMSCADGKEEEKTEGNM